jgi:hypothetical protein
MSIQQKESVPQFAVCIEAGSEDLLTPRKIYEVLPDESAAKSNYIRVIDDEGEDYLYPAKYFIILNFTPEVSRAIQQAA